MPVRRRAQRRRCAPLADAVADAEWIIHAASQDLPCLAELGLRPTTLFDTELAGRLLNYPAGRARRARRGAARLPDAQGALGRRLVAATAARAVAAVCRARRRGADRAARRPRRPARRGRQARVGAPGVRGLGRRASSPRPERALAAYVGHPSGAGTPRARPGAGDVGAARRARPQPRHHDQPDPARRRHRRGRRRRPDVAQRAWRDSRASRRAAASATSRTSPPRSPRRSRCPTRSCPTSRLQHDGPPPPRSWADKNPVAAARLGRCRAAVHELAAEHDLPAGEPALARLRTPAGLAPAERRSRPRRSTAFLTDVGARPWQVDLTGRRPRPPSSATTEPAAP